MADFEFPTSLGDYKGEDQTKNKTPAQIYKYLTTVSTNLIDEPEKLNECTTWLDFVYFSIKNGNTTQQINNVLSDILKNQLDKAYLGTLKLGSERITVFLACCYLCWHNQIEQQEHIKVLKSFVKYIKISKLIQECFSMVMSVATSNCQSVIAHQIVAFLLSQNNEHYFNNLVVAFSAQNINCVPLLRRLNRQKLENEDEDTQIRFQELLPTSNSTFIECVILEYLTTIKPLYAKTSREVLLQLVRFLPDFFTQNNILHTLLKLYDKEQWMIRNTVTMTLGELLRQSVFMEDVEEKLLQLLLLRTHDSHVHGRSCVLYALKELISSRSVKLNAEILYKAVERLKDKSSSARRAAISLLDSIIKAYSKQYGIMTFKSSQLEKNRKLLELEKQKLIEDCQNLQEQLNRNQIDIKYYLDNLESQLNSCRDREQKLKAQQVFQNQISIAMPDLIKIALSNIHTESKCVLQVFTTLMINHQEGMIEYVKQILVLVYQAELQEDLNKLIFNSFVRNYSKLIKLIEICDMLEITCLEQLFKSFKQKNLQLKTADVWDKAWDYLKQQKYILPNLRLIRFIGIMDDAQLYDKLCYLLRHLKDTKQFSEITEIILIIQEIPVEDVHQIYIKEIIKSLQNYDGSDLEWFRACDTFIRFTVEKIQKPEITLLEFLNSIPIANIPQLMFASSTIGLKLYVYSEKMIKQYRKEKTQPLDEMDQMDNSIQEHMDGKIKELQDLFEKMGDLSEYSSSAEAICKNMITDSYKERNLMIDQISVMSLLQFMIISKSCTVRNIKTIMEILDCQQVQSIIKCNIITMLSDIYYRYSDLIDINKVLQKMDDKVLKVRRTAIIIVSHLMLMELLRIDASQIAKHINDQDQTIKKHAKIFFVELYKKDSQKFYQVLPDLITSMAHNYQVSEEDFKIFAKEIIPLVQKDKLQEQILEKFLNRFDIFDREASLKNRSIMQRVQEAKEDIIPYNPVQLTAERECVYLSFCLLYLKFHLENLRLLVTNFPQYKKVLKNPIILEQFKQIYQKCRKAASSCKMNARKTEAIQQSHEFSQLLTIFKTNLDSVDPQLERLHSVSHNQPSQSNQQQVTKPKKIQTQYRPPKKNTKQQIRIPDSDDSSSMELEY
ncbi:unnamed protein product [Paramecium octaurelia]|uniref:Condensin complex subunit 1 C-terminal domain-containing protein n=1 Tax=Paramecium octaurelia TaxID=43137 RepID=A0A8S1VFP8_PAROT|nr:unnamed protein product [Paramecium octaurelia]